MPDVRSRGRTYGRPTNEPKPRSDAYTGLLLLALLAQVAGAVFLYLDWSRYPASTPPKVTGVSTAPATPPVPGQPANPPAPAGNPVPPAGNPMPPAGNPMPPAGNPMPPPNPGK